ncbi:unnamed protein product [Rotaria socialis]|uniref:CCDC174 alpha/beta GRSR domain-containing protein n=1 Tax=Rotaria socialis TaxID=392032 RepID=A0A818T005_9BILA|nr:unnamed protein product [Rotaria socialis]CAF3680047.1 unnamed protein product [Rotaria socialis]CAF3763683.1 unnamed protein product [Rotaria socialis]CAF4204605.1 unnamed protein product [Rotaria socialis]CAF4522519.1 unnamed protein product [Rotaria socialis]
MNQEERKTYDNTSSSYLSLKAELLRKKQDIQKVSSSSTSSSAILDNLQSTSSSLKLKAKSDLDIEVVSTSKKKKKTEDVAPPPSASTLSRQDEIAFAKSRAMLEAKSKLYDQIMSNGEMRLLAEDDGDEDNDKSFLVDFERKIYEANRHLNKVEYTDSFGRTRLVTQDEFEEFKKSEKKISQDKPQSNSSDNEIERVERLHRQQMRSKWEAEMDAIRDKTQLHYQDVLFDEKREHGVGYYNFSTDDKQRAEQMATLNELRTNTKNEKSKFIHEKEQRQSITSDRLNKIRLRKAKEMGIHLPETNESTLESIKEPHIESDIKESSNVSMNKEDEIMKPVSIDKNFEKEKELNRVEIVRSIPEQSSQQTLQTTSTQLKPPARNNNQITQKSNSSLAYPFPVIRSSTSSSLSDTYDLYSSNIH